MNKTREENGCQMEKTKRGVFITDENEERG